MILAGTPAQRILEISGDMPATPQNSPQKIQVKLIVEERRVQKVVISTDPRDKPHSDPQIAVPVDTYFRRIRIDPSPHQTGELLCILLIIREPIRPAQSEKELMSV